MLHGIVVALCRVILDHVLPAELIMLHDIALGRGQGQGLDRELGLGLKAYAKQVKIMCVLSVPLLDQPQGFLDSFRRWETQ